MLKLTTALSALFLSLFFISCQKEISGDLPQNPTEQEPPTPDTPVGDIQGNYKFISVTQTSDVTQQITSGSDVAKTVTIAAFTSTNNTGTLKIGVTTMTTNNMSYTANMVAKVYTYSNGSLLDSTDMPFAFNIPPSSGTVSYKMIGSDSIYFSSGTMLMSDIMQPTHPIGARLKVEGDKLYITQNVNLSTTQNVQGATIFSVSKAIDVITLQKL